MDGTNARVTASARKTACPSDDELAELVEGRLQGEALAAAEGHVADCARCRELVAALLGGAEEPDETSPPSEKRIGRYVVLSPIGAGAMGVVYTAYDPDLDRKVALKLLRADPTDDAEATRAALLREAKAMAQVSHANVVSVFDAGTFHDRVFVAMELVRGETLRAWSARGPRTWREVVTIFAEAGRGLSAAHEAGLVHRDFKPDNVLVSAEGHAKVTDFGLARVVTVAEAPTESAEGDPHTTSLVRTVTRFGVLRGTPAYMAPEQLEGAPADARADQFGFGVALYEALAGARPFAGKTLEELRASVLSGQVETTKSLRAVPASVRKAVERMLRKNPADRFASMDDVVHELQRPLRTRPILWVGVAAAAVAIALVAGRASGSAAKLSPCAGVDGKGASLWTAEARDRVKNAFVATKAPFAEDTFKTVDSALASYAKGWSSERVATCEATRVRAEQSEELFDLRMDCLDSKLQAATALVDAFGTTDRAGVEGAAQAVQTLPPFAACANAESLRARVKPPSDPSVRAKVDALTKDLASARASSELAKYEEAHTKISGVIAGARATGYGPLLGQALLLDGRVLDHSNRYKESADALREAAWTSMAAKDDETTFASSALLVVLLKYRLAQEVEGQTWDRTADALLTARGKGPRDEAILEESRGIVDRALGHYEDACAHTARAIELERKMPGDAHLELATTLTSHGYSLTALGRYDDARAALEEARTIREGALGREHPLVAQVESRLGLIHAVTGHLDEALVALKRAFAIQTAALGPEAIETGYTMNRIGVAYLARGDGAEAHELFEQVLRLGTKVLGPDHPEIGLAHMNLALSLHEIGRRDEAEKHLKESQRLIERMLGKGYAYLATVKADLGTLRYEDKQFDAAEKLHREAIALGEAALGKEHPDLVSIRRWLAEDLLAKGRPDEAARMVEEALARTETKKMNHPDEGACKFTLAKALRAAKKEPNRARAAAEAARTLYRYDSPRDKRMRAAIDAWLAQPD